MEYIKQEITKYSEQSSKFVATLQRAKKASAEWCMGDKLTQPLYTAFPKTPNHQVRGDSGQKTQQIFIKINFDESKTSQ